ncbi:MAG: membrane protein insertion efficiency factor YidD [Epsilonproteobacteria bacterium]|nr:MAG: membrane protein insertion efficiency factor YidD [Campylobacterota bacterium]
MTKNIFLAPIKGYQYISKMLPASCRYYPSCSEYASWQFEFNAPHKAFMASSLRILRCNQFFKGGIDYPIVEFNPTKSSYLLCLNTFCGKIPILFWIVPKNTKADNKYYYILKDFNAIKRST